MKALLKLVISLGVLLIICTTANAAEATQKSFVLRTGFTLQFSVTQTDISTNTTRQAINYYANQDSGPISNAHIQSSAPAESDIVTISSAPGGLRYHIKGNDIDQLFDYDASTDTSLTYQSRPGKHVWISNGFDNSGLPVVPMPGVGLYSYNAFSTTQPLSGLVTGVVTSPDQAEGMQAQARFTAIGGAPACSQMSIFYDSPGPNKIARDTWSFEDYSPFLSYNLAKSATHMLYFQYVDPDKSGVDNAVTAPWILTSFRLVSIKPSSDDTDYSTDHAMALFRVPGYTGVQYFNNHSGGIAFLYNPAGGLLDVQKRRAEALETAIGMKPILIASSPIPGLMGLGLIMLAVLFYVVRRRAKLN